MIPENLGRKAFEAYSSAKQGKTYDDKPIPDWGNLPADVQAAWGAAANAVLGLKPGEFPRTWIDAFDERAVKEIEFDRIYARDFKHGTDGHNARLIIAKMADLLDTK